MDGYDDIAAQEAAKRSTTPAPAPDDTYDAMAAAEADKRSQVLKASISQATQVAPDRAGKVQTLVDKTGLPHPVVERNEDYVASRQRALELYQALQASPILMRQMSDPAFAKIAQDDTPTLSIFEQVARFPWKATQSIASGLPALAGGLAGVVAAPFELASEYVGKPLAGKLLPGDPFAPVGAAFRRTSSNAAAYAKQTADVPKDAGLVQAAVASGFQSLGQNLPLLITALYTGNTGLALSVMSAATGGQSYTKGREAGLSPIAATRYGMTDAAVEYLTEIMPVTKLIGDMKAGSPFIKTLMHNQVAEQLGEQAATVLQDYNEWATLTPDKPFVEYLKERPAAALQTAIATVIGSGGQVAILHAAQASAGRDSAVGQAKQDAQALQQLLAQATASKLRERSPGTFAQFVDAAAAAGPVDAVYVNAAQFQQGAREAGIDIAQTMPETAAALGDAVANNSDVRIPLGEFATTIPGTVLEQAIIPHLRTSPDGPTQAETSDAAWVAETKAQTEKILAEHEFNSSWKQSSSIVERELMTQLEQANRFTPDVNKAYSGLMAAFYATQAHRLGITPEQMYVKYPLQIRAQSVMGAGTLEQHASAFKPAGAQVSGLTVRGAIPNRSSIGASFTSYNVLPGVREVPMSAMDRQYVEGVRGKSLDARTQKLADEIAASGEINPLIVAIDDKGPYIVEGGHRFDALIKAGVQSFPALVVVAPEGGVLEQSAKTKDPTKTRTFKKWSQGAQVIGPDEFGDYDGGPAVFKVFHGTTADFTNFDRARANPESDLGAGFYFTNTPEDVSVNYAGEGPDLTNKIQALAERIASDTDREYSDPEVVAEAKTQLSVQHGGAVMPVFVNLQNPVVIGGKHETRLTYEAVQDEDGEFTGDEKGTLVDFIMALRDVAAQYHDGGVNDAIGVLVELGMDGDISAGGVFNTLKGNEQFAYYTDDNGNLVGHEIVRQAFERAGFDGFVDYTPHTKFGPSAMRKGMAGMNPETVHVVAFEPEQIKSAVGNRGTFDASNPNILEQSSRGTFDPDTNTIALLANADLSTFLHESGHFYLEVLADIAHQADAPTSIQADFDAVMNWFGVQPGQWELMTLDQKRPYHEQWARGFEAYLFEGRAPSTEVQGLFARFRAWMLNVYRQLQALNVTLTDEVRGVMDRLLATNDEIIAAENARNMGPLFEAKPDGVTDAAWKDYQALGIDATQAAVDELQTRSVRDMQWATGARGRALKALQADATTKRKGVRAEVTAEVSADKLYAADYGLRHGWVQDDGSKINVKFNTAALAEMYPQSMTDRPDLTKLRGMTNAESGLHPDQVAELTGFTSGDELVRKLIDAEPRASVIEGITDQRMLERYGDLADPASIAKAADEAVHSEARARFVATELRALTKATGQRNIITKAARQFAEAMIARKKIREIRPAQYAAAETRAAKAAERAFGKDDVATAAAQKRTQLVNLYATKAAYGALDEVEKGVAYLKRVAESKTVDPEYREQIDALLERFDLRAVTAKEAAKRRSLADWIEQQKDKGFEPVIDAALVNEATRKPYREMPLEEFRGLVDSVRNIEHLGRLKHKLLTLKDQREFAAVVEQLTASIEDNAKRTIPTKLEHNTWTDKMKSGIAEFFAMHRKFSMMAREIDGHADNGVFWNLLVRPMNEAGDTESVMREQATIRLQALFNPMFKQGKLHEKLFIPEINASLSREGRIMVALNAGNEGNLQRLMDGDHWTGAQVQAVIDTLTKQEMDFVQSVWDFIAEYRTKIGEQQKRLTGVEPEWVEPIKVVTPHGEYAGGYLPAKYDTTRSTRSLADEAAAGIMDQWRGQRGIAKARDSFTKERANKVVDRPLRKDFGVITQHVTEVTHRLAWQEYLTDANRLLRASAVDNAIRNHYGPEVLKALRDTVEDVAAGEVGAQNSFERAVNYLRTGATIAGLGWRITTSLLQPIGLTQSMVRIGPKWVGKGLAEWLGDVATMESTTERIFEKSSMMRLRAKTMQREISEIRNQVSGKSSVIEGSYFYLIQKMQLVADIPTWLGQYHKAVDGGADEKGAIAQADQAVLDAQGGGQIKDLAAIQRGGPMLKLFTNFYSFFNTTYNLTGEAVGRTSFKSPLQIGLLAVDLLLLYSIPAALGTLMKAALHAGDDDQDQKKVIRTLIADQLTYMFGTMVGMREAAGVAQTALGLPGDYQGPASVRLFAELAKLGKQAGQGELDEALFKAANSTGGILFHYPAGQINATADGIATMARGRTSNPGALIVGSSNK